MTNPNRPSAPAPRSSPSNWRTSEIVKAYRHRIAMQMGNEFLADYHDDLDLLCDAVVSCGERGGGLEAAANVCESYAQECGRNVRLAEDEGGFERTLWANHGVAAQECAIRIRALSSSPPENKA